LLSHQQELVLWQQIIKEDIAELDGFSLMHPRAAASRAKTARDRLLLFQAERVDGLWSHFQFDEDCRVFARWAQQFEQRLSQLAATTRYEAYQQLLTTSGFEKESVGLYAAPQLAPLPQRVLEHLCQVTLIEPPCHQQDHVVAVAFSTRETELAAAAEWAYENSQQANARTAIVLLDLEADRDQLEYRLREQFGCLDAQYNDLPVNFSTGMPLGATPMYRDLLLALEWETRSLSRAEWLALLRSPFLPFSHEQPQQTLALIDRQFQAGSAQVSLESTLHMSATVMPESTLAATLRNLRSSRQQLGVKSLSEWSDVLRERLNIWQWPARASLDSIEYQQLDRLDSSLDALADLAVVLPHQTFDSALTLWRAVLNDAMFQPKTPYDSVQVMGPLEALGGQYTAMWICGAQQSTFPAKRRIEPFLPLPLQKALGLPEMDEQAWHDAATQMLGIWRAESATLMMTYHESDGGLPTKPSCLITERAEYGSTGSLWGRWHAIQAVEAMPLDVALPVPEGHRTGGTSLIKDQAACPFRALVKHRLRPTSLATAVMGFSSAERGALLHEALFRFWREVDNQRQLKLLSDETLQSTLYNAIRGALQDLQATCERRGFSLRERVGPACWELETKYCRQVLLPWLQLEQKREGPFRVAEAEQAHRLRLGELELSLRPDRVDELEDGRRMVIDYKTRAPARSQWMGARPGEPQLPLYALLDNKIEGIAFASMAEQPPQFVGLGEALGLTSQNEKPLQLQTKGVAEQWQELVEAWRSSLTALANDFIAGNAQVDPVSGACRYCNLSSVCRVRQLDQTEMAQAGEVEDVV
jgi:probable DNA repair protein